MIEPSNDVKGLLHQCLSHLATSLLKSSHLKRDPASGPCITVINLIVTLITSSSGDYQSTFDPGPMASESGKKITARGPDNFPEF